MTYRNTGGPHFPLKESLAVNVLNAIYTHLMTLILAGICAYMAGSSIGMLLAGDLRGLFLLFVSFLLVFILCLRLMLRRLDLR